MHLGSIKSSLCVLLLLVELGFVEEDVGVELLGTFLLEVDLPLLVLFYLLFQRHSLVLDRLQSAIVLDLLPNRQFELPLIVLDIVLQLCFIHDLAELFRSFEIGVISR